MAQREILIDHLGNMTAALVREDGQAVELLLSLQEQAGLVGNVYKGKVINVIGGMNAAFIDIGLDKNAFLPLSDVPAGTKLQVGKEALVQVVKEPGGEKGPRLTMNLTVPGNCVVLMPKTPGIGVSRHIEDAEKRKTLHEEAERICPQDMGLIVRTAAEENPAQLEMEVPELFKRWSEIEERFRQENAPALLWSAGNLQERIERDLAAGEDTRVIVDPINDDEIAKTIEEIGKRRVWLSSGGFLVIDPCEALTVIDVNSGKSALKGNQEENLCRLNCEAARETARQIRLRDMGGIIVIDFIDMQTEESRKAVEDALAQSMKNDRAKYHLHGFTSAGLYELTRRPVQGSLHLTTRQACTLCQGSGTMPKEEITAHEALRQVRRRRRSGDEGKLLLKAHAKVLGAFKEINADPAVRVQAENIKGFTLESDLGGDAT